MPSHAGVAFRNVSFSYSSSEKSLISDLSAYFPGGFTGIAGANGSGKTTLLRLAVGELVVANGLIEGAEAAIYCAQRTDSPPATMHEFLEDWRGFACELRGRLDIDNDYLDRWDSLSHGERKRAQIGHALWCTPPVLAIDEPTNHIDSRARALLIDSLKRYPGVGLIVSHDRELLDELCTQCLWLEPPHHQMFTGGVTSALEQRQAIDKTALKAREKAVKENKRLNREIVKRREESSREHKLRSKRGLGRKDSDAREKIDRARVADSGAGSKLRALDGRFSQAQARLEATRVKKAYATGIWLPGSRSSRDAVLTLEPGELSIGHHRKLKWSALSIKPEDRVALTGPNGAGKSTWIEHVRSLINVPAEKQVYLPQEVSASAARSLLARVQALPKAQLGHIMTIVSRLNSRPERLLQSQQPSPGEVRKLLLAMGMSYSPHVIIMDEPTNHLDLPSIEALEQALADCPCALLLVSHDARFIENVGAQPWALETDERGDSVLVRP